MRPFLAAAFLALTTVSGHADDATTKTRLDPWSTKPIITGQDGAARPKPANPCSQYGAGFVQIEGTSTCIQGGGAVGITAGSGSRH